jgi:hypothetical protein
MMNRMTTRSLSVAAPLIFVVFALFCLYGAFGPWQWGHNGFNGAAFCQAARNAIRFHIPGQALYYTGLEKPGAELIYTHHPQLLHWHLVVLFKVLGQAPWVGRMVPVFYSVATLVLIHHIGVRLWDRLHAVVAMALYAFTPLHTIFANMIDHEQGAIFFVLLTVYQYVRWLDGYARWRLVLMLATISLGAQFDWPAYYIAFFLAVHAFVRAVRARKWCPEWTFVIVFSIVVLINFGGFFLWIRSVRGTLEEMGKAYVHRTNVMEGYGMQLYARMLDMHGPVIMWATGLWLPLVIVRARRRELHPRDLIAGCFFAAQVIHSSVFKSAGFIHSYWTYYLGVATAFGGAEVLITVASWLLKKREAGVFVVVTLSVACALHLMIRSYLKLRWAFADGTGSYIVPYPDQGPEIRFARFLGSTFDRNATHYVLHSTLSVRIEFHWYHDAPYEGRQELALSDMDARRGKRVLLLVDASKTGARASIGRLVRTHPTWILDRRFLAIELNAVGSSVHAYRSEVSKPSLIHRWFVDPLHPPARLVDDDSAEAFAAFDYPDTQFESETVVSSGQRFEWDCPLGEWLGAVEATPNEQNSAIARLHGTCRTAAGADATGTMWWGGRTPHKPTLMACRRDSYLVGIYGRYGKTIETIGALCASVHDKVPDSDHPIQLGPVGASMGNEYRLMCPYNMVVRGLRVRAGALIDSAGIACGTLY